MNNLYVTARESAVSRVGPKGWTILSPTLRRALVADSLLYVLGQQDESVDDSTVRTLIEEFWTDLVEDFPGV